MTKIGDIITALPVPDDVIKVRDRDGDPWHRGDDGSWTCRSQFDGATYGELSGVDALRMLECAPLRVTKVTASEVVQRLARVGDVIEHGQVIPANVRVFTDRDGDRWVRTAPAWYTQIDDPADDADPVGGGFKQEAMQRSQRWWPMKVVEVDPESQPAERHPHGERAECSNGGEHRPHYWDGRSDGRWCPGLSLDPEHEPAAPSGPLELTLPEEPKGATALVGVESGRRWEPTPVNGGRWQDVVSGQIRPWIGVLEREGSVTVEFAPPREPRAWPKLDGHEFDSLPDAVTVDDDDHRGVWRRCSPEGVLYSDGMSGMTLAELRTLGTVTEVFGDA